MISVRVDNNELHADLAQLQSMGDLVELIKSSIDPDSIIVSLQLNGEELSESDWRSPLTAHSTKQLEVETGTKEEYIEERLKAAPDILFEIRESFRSASKSYQDGVPDAGNETLATAVQDLSAFIGWFQSILEVDPDKLQEKSTAFSNQVDSLQKVCETLVQQQMYNSWWLLGETLREKLDPELVSLHEFLEQPVEQSHS